MARRSTGDDPLGDFLRRFHLDTEGFRLDDRRDPEERETFLREVVALFEVVNGYGGAPLPFDPLDKLVACYPEHGKEWMREWVKSRPPLLVVENCHGAPSPV